MGLVGYSDSEDEVSEAPESPPPSKKRKLEDKAPVKVLPPLPSTFHDLYSSTVRTSTQDDSALHGGRKRVTPHVEGNWPTHVYLEWHPEPKKYEQLSALIEQKRKQQPERCEIRSLLHNELGVSLPLHVSLSRPLVLKTEQRDRFLTQLKQAISTSRVRTFDVRSEQLKWHPNEVRTRWFLVLQLRMPERDELAKLLSACNTVAASFDQPSLYSEAADEPNEQAANGERTGPDSKFHISIAWSLNEPEGFAGQHAGRGQATQRTSDNVSFAEGLQALTAAFSEVKVRIGQDVTSIPLPASRTKRDLFT